MYRIPCESHVQKMREGGREIYRVPCTEDKGGGGRYTESHVQKTREGWGSRCLGI